MPDPQNVTLNNPGSVTPGASPATPGVSANAGAVNPVPTSVPNDVKQGASSQPTDAKGGQQTVPLAALHEEREKRQALQAEVEQLKNLVQQSVYQQPQQQQQYQAPQPQQQVQNPAHQELERLWESDPRKAVQGEILLAMDWYDRINAGLDSQADQLSQKHPDFNNYRSQAYQYMRSLPLTQRSNPGALELAYFVVRGRNTDSIVKSREQELYQQFQQNPAQFQTPPGMSSQPQVPQGGVQLTDEQRAVAAVMGMSEDEYARNIQIRG